MRPAARRVRSWRRPQPWRHGRHVAVAVVSVLAATARTMSAAPLDVCHAGSVQAAFSQVEKEFTRQHPAIQIHDVSGGSVALAGRMAAGVQPCDVFAAADYLDIDRLLKPQGLADYTVVFAKGRMVLAYLASDPAARGVAASEEFKPPASIPAAAADWYRRLLEPGVRISGSHPFLDPSGYRAHMIFNLAERFYRVPNLANLLLEHYSIVPADAGAGRTLGKDFNFQLIYEHSAAAAARTNPAYRYTALPDRLDLSNAGLNTEYAKAVVTMPGLSVSAAPTSIPASRVAWGVTIPTSSKEPAAAVAFLELLLGPVGTAALTADGPAPIAPPFVSRRDYTRLPHAVQPLVAAGSNPP